MMPDEQRIDQFIESFQKLAKVSGTRETTKIVPNNLVIESTPSDLSASYIIVEDELGYYIPAVKTANLIVESGQFVNLLYVEGSEPIAFQQGSEGTANIALWQLVGGTGPDIYYNNGNISIGKITSPDATLEVLDTTTQLRLTHTDASKYAEFAVDTSHHLTINPSSTGQIKLDATVTIIDEIQHEGDANTKIGFTSDKQTYTIGGLVAFQITNTTQDLVEIGDVAGTGDWDVNFNNDQVFLQGSNGRLGINKITPSARLHISAGSATAFQIDGTHGGTIANIAPVETGSGGSVQIWRQVPSFEPSAALTSALNFNTNVNLANSVFDVTNVIPIFALVTINASYSGDVTKVVCYEASGLVNNGTGTTVTNFQSFGARNEDAATNNYGFWSDFSAGANKWALYLSGTADSYIKGDLGVGISVPLAKAHIDQVSTTATIPVLSLDQADLSEEFINFITTVGAGNPIDTAAIGTYYGKARVAVNGTFKYVTLYNS